MITIESRTIFSFEGLNEDEKEAYIKKADEYENYLKAKGIFWGRVENNSSITIISQKYLDVKRLIN